MNVLLSGVVGSTAYGLATPESDKDVLGVYAVDTVRLHGLDLQDIRQSQVTTNPDVTMHEVYKWCTLALGCNPTVMELVWLSEYETVTELGEELISIRQSFLSSSRVRAAYLGYATQQLKKIQDNQAHLLNEVVPGRTAKHARHLYRLLLQGFELWSTGRLTIELEHPDIVMSFGAQVALGHTNLAADMVKKFERLFDNTPTVLPAEPDRAAVDTWLRKVRAYYFR